MNFSRGNFLKKLILLITQNTDYSCSSLVQSFPSQGFNLSMFSIWHNSAQLTILVWKVKLFLSPDFVTSFFCQMSLLSKQILLKVRQTGKPELNLTWNETCSLCFYNIVQNLLKNLDFDKCKIQQNSKSHIQLENSSPTLANILCLRNFLNGFLMLSFKFAKLCQWISKCEILLRYFKLCKKNDTRTCWQKFCLQGWKESWQNSVPSQSTFFIS